jgi:dimethylamine/trimethylamine dehydrogenase
LLIHLPLSCLENRARLLKELVEVTREAAGPDLAVTVRLIVDELQGETGLQAAVDGIGVVELLDDYVDLWDLIVGTWKDDSLTSRFSSKANHEEYIKQFRAVTKKPIVGVGRFTSPDTMVSQIKRGVLDMIGATRPSIADPFIPNKIDEGRTEDIRECIGCNICVSTHRTMAPIRCTQNPTMGEEWRKGWHPEHMPAKGSDDNVLVVGVGPAGLECARALGARGYRVTLAEATRELGGRVHHEARLPGLAEWGRVRDWRVTQLSLSSKLVRAAVIQAEFDLTTQQFMALRAWLNGFPESGHRPRIDAPLL